MFRLTKSKIPIIVIVLVIGLSACGREQNTKSTDSENIQIVATTGMIADVVRQIGGDRVNVVQMMGAGIDPHLYTATEGDVSRLTEAEMIIYNGIHLEARMTDIFEQIGKSKPAIAVGDRIPQEIILSDMNFDAKDPHIWMDAGRWYMVTEIIRDALIDFDPGGEEDFRSNTAAYLNELLLLDAYIKEKIETIPQEQRVLVTAHDAFQYYSDAYGIEVFAPQGITTESEASVEDIRAVIAILNERSIPAIFIESSVPPDVVEAIVEGASASGHEVKIGGQLFSDAMGATGSPEGTYLGMLRHNTDTIVSALLEQEP